METIYNQQEFNIRCEGGEQGVVGLALISDGVIIVDVLSFSTSVVTAVENGALVFPYSGRVDRAVDFDTSLDAKLVDSKRSKSEFSLSPASLRPIKPGVRLGLPSPNGARLTPAAKPGPVFAGCLRNGRVVALAAGNCGRRIAVIAAGERWPNDHSLRPAWEDLIDPGAIISQLSGTLSPEASSAVPAVRDAKPRLEAY